MGETPGTEQQATPVQLDLGQRQDFARVEFSNTAGLSVALYKNGGTIGIYLNGLMINQIEGHPLQGGLDNVYFRKHTGSGIDSVAVSGATVPCSFHDNGVCWQQEQEGITPSMQLLLHPELPLLIRVCTVTNNGNDILNCDWMVGQDLGLADSGALKNNEAYVCQYLDHRIVDHSVAGKVLLSRNNLHPQNPLAMNCCLHGAQSVSSDGYQFFGTTSKLSGKPVALDSATLENRVRQYEFAYAALQSQKITLAPGQISTIVFALYVLDEHPQVSSTADLALVDKVLQASLPSLGEHREDGNNNAFFLLAPMLACEPLDRELHKSFFAGNWRHTEYSTGSNLYSYFCAGETHVVLPAKEAIAERQHGSVLLTALGVELGTMVSDDILSVNCYGYGAFGSQLSLGNTTFGRFSTILRNSLNLDRCSGLRIFMRSTEGWKQLGFPSAFSMMRDHITWVYNTGDSIFSVHAQASADCLHYTATRLSGTMPALRMTWEVCGTPNEFDGAPQVTWDGREQLLCIRPAQGSLLQQKFPESCLLAKWHLDEVSVGNAMVLGGTKEPYVVIDIPTGQFWLKITGHYAGSTPALTRLQSPGETNWPALTARFRLECHSPAAAKLSDTINWYAHNALIHYAAPRGMEQYNAAAWGTRDVCQGPLEFLLAFGHDRQVADMLCEVFAHQYPDDGAWPQWFMFDEFREIQNREAHGDIVFWPIKALCTYIEQTGHVTLLDKAVCYTDPHTFGFTAETAPLHEHLAKAVNYIYQSCVAGTALPSYGNGDWDDSLQPANPAMKTHMVSGWTAALAYETLSALSKVWKLAGYSQKAEELDNFLARLQNDFNKHVIRDGVAAGFVLFDGMQTSALLHPSDQSTGIHYRLLPINQAISAELFSPAQMEEHLGIVRRYLTFPDGVRLMDRSPQYTGGKSVHFQRAETAAHFGREIGLQYVHANIRYGEALAKVGRADELLDLVLRISPVAIADVVPNAQPRQANLYFSSSDAQVYDRYEAAASMEKLREGKIGALAGWRLYSSGPGIYIALVINHLFGIRRSFGEVVLDPVLPPSMNGAQLSLDWQGKCVSWNYHCSEQSYAPQRVLINGTTVNGRRIKQPYREGGFAIDTAQFDALLHDKENVVDIYL
jgi:CRISPR-associated protein Csx3